MLRAAACSALLLVLASCGERPAHDRQLRIELVVDLGADMGQPLGTLFELRDGDRIVAAAGAQQVNGTHQSNNGRVVAFFVSNDGPTTVTDIGDPFPDIRSHTRLFNWRDTLYAFTRSPFTPHARRCDGNGGWHDAPAFQAHMGAGVRNIELVRGELLVFHDHAITYKGDTLLHVPGIDHLNGIYRDGQMLVHLYQGSEGPNRIVLAAWELGLDELRPIAEHLDPGPVPASSYTYCKTYLDTAFLVGTNFGGLYVVEEHGLNTEFLRNEGDPSWQPYCFLTLGDAVLIGHYPSGSLLRYSDEGLAPHSPPIETPAWAPGQNREAQSLSLYAGALFAGVWPWGELHELDLSAEQWKPPLRLFRWPDVENGNKIAEHWDAPYVELFHQHRNGAYNNEWGQRINGFALHGDALYATTAKKTHAPVDPADVVLLGSEVTEQYGRIHRIHRPGAVAAQIVWKRSTRLEMICAPDRITIIQDGDTLVSSPTGTAIRSGQRDLHLRLGDGLYGRSPAVIRLQEMRIDRWRPEEKRR